jgi:hypothetical protein
VQRLLRTAKKLQNQFDKGLKGAAEKSRAVHGGPVSWVRLALLVVTGIGLLLYWDQEKKWQLKAPIEALLQIVYTSCLLYMGFELRCIWSEGECKFFEGLGKQMRYFRKYRTDEASVSIL